MGNVAIIIILILIAGVIVYYYYPEVFPQSVRGFIDNTKGMVNKDAGTKTNEGNTENTTDVSKEEYIYVDYGYPKQIFEVFKCTSDENCIMHLDNPDLKCNMTIGKCYKLIKI